jgi:hypothetical protein
MVNGREETGPAHFAADFQERGDRPLASC